ncbi:TPA: hypothetical protein ACSRFK_003051 [Clostridioides difficile]|uniref:hypothetical protein n=2 Tax=Clostridioides difficile TaxID=1496 RepID=UPI00111ABC6B|nr:hypothetical protein [Clostridioides difficile]
MISHDANTIMNIYNNINGKEYAGVFFMGIIPYTAICIDSALEFFNEFFEFEFEHDIEEEWKLAKEIRVKIKLYNDKIKNNADVLNSIHEFQNEYFKNMCRFKFIKNLNLCYDLGTYLLENKYIGNTFLYHWYYGCDKKKKIYNFNGMKDRSFTVDVLLGKVISICNEIGGKENNINILNSNLELKHKDYNLSRSKYKIFSKNYDENLTTIVFNILCSINFVLYFLSSILPSDNQLYFRIKYICYYYSIHSIKKIENYTKSNHKKGNKIDVLYKRINELKTNQEIINTDFRSCMAHYIIKQEYIKENELLLDVPLYGLVEKYFGKDYVSLNNEIHDNLVKLANVIEDFILAKPY